jgi:hypothetical protein
MGREYSYLVITPTPKVNHVKRGTGYLLIAGNLLLAKLNMIP